MRNNIVDYYKNDYDESKRLTLDNRHKIEFDIKKRIYMLYITKNHHDAKVLEISCGTGAYTIYLAQQGIDITACDLCEEHINKLDADAKKLGLDIKTFVCDATELPFDDGQFDVVIIGGALYHLDDEGKLKAIDEAYRVSKSYSHTLCDFLPKTHAIFQHLFRYKEFTENVNDGIFYYDDKENIEDLSYKSKFRDAVSFMNIDCISRFAVSDINELPEKELQKFEDFLCDNILYNVELINLSEHAIVCFAKLSEIEFTLKN